MSLRAQGFFGSCHMFFFGSRVCFIKACKATYMQKAVELLVEGNGENLKNDIMLMGTGLHYINIVDPFKLNELK